MNPTTAVKDKASAVTADAPKEDTQPRKYQRTKEQREKKKLRRKQALLLIMPQKKQHKQGNTKGQKNKGKEKLQLLRAQSLRTKICLPPQIPRKSLYQNGDR